MYKIQLHITIVSIPNKSVLKQRKHVDLKSLLNYTASVGLASVLYLCLYEM